MKFPDTLADVGDLVVGQRRVHREQKASREQTVCVRKADTRESQSFELVYRPARPLDDRADAVFLELRAQVIATIRLDLVVLVYVEMVGVGIGPGRENKPVDPSETIAVQPCNLPPTLDFGVQLLKLYVENRRLQVVETRIESPGDYQSRLVAAMIAKQRHLPRHFGIVRQEDAAVTKTAEYLGGIEADFGRDSKSAGVPSLEL